MNISFMRAGALFALFASCAAGALAQPGFAPQPLELTQVQNDLYVIRNGQSGNVTMLVTDDGVLLIDDKFEFDHDNIMQMVASVTEQPVKYIVNTHFHQDHSGGNALMQAGNSVVLASSNARRKMVEDDQSGLPNITLDEHLRLHVGDVPIDLYYFGRAHTDGDVVVHLPDHDVVVMGDMFAGANVQLIHYAGGGSARDWPASLAKALALDFVTVIPGHSPVTDRAALVAYRDYTQRMANMVLEMNRQDRTRDEIEQVLRTEFNWGDFFIDLGLDGVITEMQ
jgi:glyoxylase-like metal-dependent hydrolase (beta-lactamase superfamily II)